MFLNGDSLELDLIKNLKGYEVTFVDHRDKEPVQVNVSELIQILNITSGFKFDSVKSVILESVLCESSVLSYCGDLFADVCQRIFGSDPFFLPYLA